MTAGARDHDRPENRRGIVEVEPLVRLIDRETRVGARRNDDVGTRSRDGLLETPRRVAKMYAEVCGGLRENPCDHLVTQFEAGHQEMVIVKDIPIYSLCEHHLVPFMGVAHLGYIPNEEGRITGLF